MITNEKAGTEGGRFFSHDLWTFVLLPGFNSLEIHAIDVSDGCRILDKQGIQG